MRVDFKRFVYGGQYSAWPDLRKKNYKLISAQTALLCRKRAIAQFTGYRQVRSPRKDVITRVQYIDLHILSLSKSKDCLNGRRFFDEPESEVTYAETPKNNIL